LSDPLLAWCARSHPQVPVSTEAAFAAACSSLQGEFNFRELEPDVRRVFDEFIQ